MQFDRVADDARRQNNWEVIGIVKAKRQHGVYPGGVIVFDRPALNNETNEKIHGTGISFGTAAFVIGRYGAITFMWGHYDMNHDDALADFAARCEKER